MHVKEFGQLLIEISWLPEKISRGLYYERMKLSYLCTAEYSPDYIITFSLELLSNFNLIIHVFKVLRLVIWTCEYWLLSCHLEEVTISVSYKSSFKSSVFSSQSKTPSCSTINFISSHIKTNISTGTDLKFGKIENHEPNCHLWTPANPSFVDEIYAVISVVCGLQNVDCGYKRCQIFCFLDQFHDSYIVFMLIA